MKTLYFVRTGPYEYKIPGRDLYDSFNVVAIRECDPGLKDGATEYIAQHLSQIVPASDLILTSPTRRSSMSGKSINNTIYSSPLLYEVKYRMDNFIDRNDFYINNVPNVTKARKAFVRALIDSELEESYSEVLKRVSSLLELVNARSATTIVLFSHGFFLKIVEAYIRDQEIITKPQKLLRYFTGEVETFKFCEGFVVEENNKSFTFRHYINTV